MRRGFISEERSYQNYESVLRHSYTVLYSAYYECCVYFVYCVYYACCLSRCRNVTDYPLPLLLVILQINNNVRYMHMSSNLNDITGEPRKTLWFFCVDPVIEVNICVLVSFLGDLVKKSLMQIILCYGTSNATLNCC